MVLASTGVDVTGVVGPVSMSVAMQYGVWYYNIANVYWESVSVVWYEINVILIPYNTVYWWEEYWWIECLASDPSRYSYKYLLDPQLQVTYTV